MSDDVPMIETWRGKRIADQCSRDELLDCIKYLAGKYREYTEASHAIALGQVEMMKRGER